MSRDTNPHFYPQQPPLHQSQHPQPQHSPNLQLPTRQPPQHQSQPWSEHDPNIHFPMHQHPQHHHEHPRSGHDPNLQLPTRQQPQQQTRPWSEHDPNLQLPTRQQPQQQTRPWSEHDPNIHFPLHHHPEYQHEQPRSKQPKLKKKPSRSSQDPRLLVPASQLPQRQKHPRSPQDPNLRVPAHEQPPQRQDEHPQAHLVPIVQSPQPHRSNDQRTPSQNQPLRVPRQHKTKPIAWFIAVFCALLWIIIIVGGLVILIVYILFRPKSPKFDVSSATLNAAYLDMGYLLNADLTLLANFSNPNKKVRVDFGQMTINLYYESVLIATRSVEPFTVRDKRSKFATVHMVTSQVPLSLQRSQHLRMNMESNRVMFEIRGLFRTRSSLGNFLRYSYWLYGHCTIVMTGPPGGVLVAKKCRTKR
ncbi:early nodule-specific protein 2-like [Cornus florida]|uniref:early nodule-specific protein 2-like n=1 Tax=Cornus florida TaxID=4283 RepID=UPI00289C8A6B|nr:early nodule-specific protein 2-like [Cornus florida]